MLYWKFPVRTKKAKIKKKWSFKNKGTRSLNVQGVGPRDDRPCMYEMYIIIIIIIICYRLLLQIGDDRTPSQLLRTKKPTLYKKFPPPSSQIRRFAWEVFSDDGGDFFPFFYFRNLQGPTLKENKQETFEENGRGWYSLGKFPNFGFIEVNQSVTACGSKNNFMTGFFFLVPLFCAFFPLPPRTGSSHSCVLYYRGMGRYRNFRS